MNFHELLNRRTIRQFRQEPLKREDIRTLINAARKASCAANKQRLRYIAVMDPALTEQLLQWTRYAALVAPRRDPVAGKTAPAAFLAVTAVEKPSAHLYADAGAAIQSIEFAAWELGIGCCWIGSFDQIKTAALLDFEDPDRILYLIALGYPAEAPCEEEICQNNSPKYYLDDKNCLHIPKYSVDTLLSWK